MNNTTTAQHQRSLIESFRAFAGVAAITLLLVGCLVLIGWTFDLENIKSIVPGLVAMNPVTAVCFILSGLSLLGLRMQSTGHWSLLSRACAFVIALIGILKLSGYVFGLDFLVIDQLLFSDKLVAIGAIPRNQMAPNTALNFVLAGSALLLLNLKPDRVRAAQILALLSAALGLQAVIGYLFGAQEFYGFAAYIPMALHTATAFMVFGLGILCVSAERGFMALVVTDNVGGILARRLLPAAIVLPFVLGWLRLLGQADGLYGTEFGTALLTVSSIAVFTIFVWLTASSVSKVDAARHQAEAALLTSYNELEQRVITRTAELAGTNQHLRSEITARKQAEEELRQAHDELELQVQRRTAELSQANALLQTLLDNVPDHIYFKDAEGRFIKNSRSQATALGLTAPSEVVGKTDFDFFPHAQRAYTEEQEIILSGQPLVDFEEWVIWPNGEKTWVSTTKVPLRDHEGKIIGTFGISRDITNRKRAEAGLQTARDELEAFSYSVAHDLRAPLRGIDGWSQALLEDYGAQLDEQARTYIDRVRSEIQRMGQLIDDLLQLSQLTRLEMNKQPVDLSAIAQTIATRLEESEPQRQVEFKIDQGLSVQADPHLLEAALSNLLGNAFKFTGRTPQARIEFGQTDIQGQRAFFVRDNGAGFDTAYAKRLFGAFQRLHKTSEFPGTGIGLAIVQRVIHRHGGRVWAEAGVNQGATFYFSLEEAG